jgi:hypothetical protein
MRMAEAETVCPGAKGDAALTLGKLKAYAR